MKLFVSISPKFPNSPVVRFVIKTYFLTFFFFCIFYYRLALGSAESLKKNVIWSNKCFSIVSLCRNLSVGRFIYSIFIFLNYRNKSARFSLTGNTTFSLMIPWKSQCRRKQRFIFGFLLFFLFLLFRNACLTVRKSLHRSTNVDDCRKGIYKASRTFHALFSVFQRSIDKWTDKNVKGNSSKRERRTRNIRTMADVVDLIDILV